MEKNIIKFLGCSWRWREILPPKTQFICDFIERLEIKEANDSLTQRESECIDLIYSYLKTFTETDNTKIKFSKLID